MLVADLEERREEKDERQLPGTHKEWVLARGIPRGAHLRARVTARVTPPIGRIACQARLWQGQGEPCLGDDEGRPC